MVSKEEFIQYVKNIFEKDENKKNIKSLSPKYKLTAILLLILGIVTTFGGLFFVFYNFYVCILMFNIVLLVISIIMLKVRKDSHEYYTNNYREKIIDFLLKGNSYYYMSKGFIDYYDLENSQFIKGFDTCYVGDCLEVNIPNDEGKKSKINFKLADINACELNKNQDGELVVTSVYKGMFGYVNFTRKFKCILTINSKYKRRGVKLEKVVLEDINFNERFEVMSNKQVDARYILTPDMMEKLMYLDEKIENLKIVLVDRELYISSEGFNMFELNDFKEDDVVYVFENLYDEIKVILEIVNEIKENNKVFKME